MHYQEFFFPVVSLYRSAMSQRDDLYREGIILGDFVINEFSNSPIVSRILEENESLRNRLVDRLRKRVTEYRKECLQVLRLCDFVDDAVPEPVTVPPSPSQVSRSALEALMATPLEGHTLGRKPIMTPSSSFPHIEIPQREVSSSANSLAKSGLFSGLTAGDDSSSEESTEVRIKPNRILESAAPVEIFGVLDGGKVEYRGRKRKRAITTGVFTKEGNYNAIAYGGFVHFCAGALEWPFRTAEISFTDFFHKDRSIEQ